MGKKNQIKKFTIKTKKKEKKEKEKERKKKRKRMEKALSNIDKIISALLESRGSRPVKFVNLPEQDIK